DAAHQIAEDAADQTDAEEERAVRQELRARHSEREVVDRVLEHLGRGERHGLRDDGAGEPEHERAAISAHIAEEAAKGTHLVVSIILRFMHALYVIVPALIVLWIAYRYYSAFIRAKVGVLAEARVPPAPRKYDGANSSPTSRWVLFGHHFAAIAGAGPLVGPVLAAQFGFMPGLLWLVFGVCLAGAVQDSFWLWASARRGGRSLADIARSDVSPLAGLTAAIAVLFIIVIAMAGPGVHGRNPPAASAWGTV